jgi:leucyl aminopeptidase (aminopeptidase T)
LILQVFDPQPGEKVTILVDIPHGALPDNQNWKIRREELAVKWHTTFAELGKDRSFDVNPIIFYNATGVHNAPIPQEGRMGQDIVQIMDVLNKTTLAIAMTEFSATAPLTKVRSTNLDFRAASMPLSNKSMEETALSASYPNVAKRARILGEKLEHAIGIEFEFTTGHKLFVDLRYRLVRIEEGLLPRGVTDPFVINLPAGSVSKVPYEGERIGETSKTQGELPVEDVEGVAVFKISQNKVDIIRGMGSFAGQMRLYFSEDPKRGNLADVGFGVNEKAVYTGNLLEDEKCGVHFSFGRSDHLGGTLRPEDFKDASQVAFHSMVYPPKVKVTVKNAVFVNEDLSREVIIKNGDFVIFPNLVQKPTI